MKRILCLCLFTICIYFVPVNAQQLSLSSQFYQNEILVNPAVSGVKSYLPLSMGVRRQWLNIKEAPVVQSLSTHGYVGMNLGCGGYVINDVTGPTRRTSINASTAYHLLLEKESNIAPRVLSFGLSATLSQHYFDLNKLNTYEQEDLSAYNGLNYKMIPDANFGLYYSRENSFAYGFAVHHLIQTRRDLFEVVTPFKNGFKRTYYLTGSITKEIKPHLLYFQPYAQFQMIEALPFQAEFHGKLLYKDTYWGSLGYRHKEAVIVAWGVQMKIIRLTYSYDISISRLNKYNAGSHEICLTLILKEYNANSEGKKRWYKTRDRVDF